MAMPKTAVHKNDFSVSRQYNVGLPWQLPDVDTETVTETMEHLANNYLWRSVDARYSGHTFVSLCRRERVHSRSHREIKGQITDIAQPFALDHVIQQFLRILVPGLLPGESIDGPLKLIKSEVVDAVYVPGSQSERCDPARQWCCCNHYDVRRTTFAIAEEVQCFGSCVLTPVAAERIFARHTGME